MEITTLRRPRILLPVAAVWRRRCETVASTTTIDDLDDVLLFYILYRLESTLWLVHAAATCKRWRRIIADGGFLWNVVFLRRDKPYNPVVGHYYLAANPGGGSGATFVPSSSSSSSHKQHVDGRHFSLGFLPDSSSWRLVDSSGSLLLLAKKRPGRWIRLCFPYLVFCEPLARRYLLIPRPEEMKRHRCIGAFLCRSYYFLCGSRMPLSKFQVTCVLHESYDGLSGDLGTVTAFVFRTERWRSDRSGWRRAGRATGVNLSGAESVYFVGRDPDHFCWLMEDNNDDLLVHRRDSFSQVTLPEAMKGGRPWDDRSALRVVDAGEDKARIIWLKSGVLSVFLSSNYLREDWLPEKRLRLPEHIERRIGENAVISDAGAGRLLILTPAQDRRRTISLKLNTMTIDESPHERNSRCAGVPYPYELPWPPTLSACFYGRWSKGEGWGCIRIVPFHWQ